METQTHLSEKPGQTANLSIDTIRLLRSSTALLPLEAGRRILIIDDAETLHEPAQQALLKTLEEPPPSVTILLLADEAAALLDTVRSRCQEVTVRQVSESTVLSALQRRGIEPALASEIALLSRGCAAWAISAASDRKVLQARRDERASAQSWIDSPQYERLVTAFRLGEQFSKRRPEVLSTVQATAVILRREMLREVHKRSADSGQTPDATNEYRSLQTLSRAVRATLQCLADLEANVRPRLALEAMVLAWPELEAQTS